MASQSKNVSDVVEVDVANLAKSAYGSLIAESLTPVVVGSAVYKFIPANFRTFTSGSGTATTTSNLFKVTSGTSLGTYGVIRSFRSLAYREGSGAVVRVAARFPESTANSWSGVGAFNVGDEFSFGYNGTTFGIWHRYGGKAEIQTLTLSAGASGAETATLTLASTVFTIPITSGTTQKNANEIAAYVTANSTAWEAWQVDNTVIFNSLSDGNKTGTFSYSATGTSAGSLAETTAGVSKTSVHYPQSNWNSGVFSSFDPSKGNNYQIIIKNGYGDIDFLIENPETEKFERVHNIHWANKNTTTNCVNPSLHVGIYATALDTISAVSVESPYVSAFSSGSFQRTRNPRAYSNTKSIATTNTNILTIRTKKVLNGESNQAEIEPINISLANDGTKSAIFELRGNTTLGGTTNFQNVGTNLISDYDVSGTTISGGTLLASFVVAKSSTAIIDLTSLDIRLPPSSVLTISGYMTSGAAADLSVSYIWYEDLY